MKPTTKEHSVIVGTCPARELLPGDVLVFGDVLSMSVVKRLLEDLLISCKMSECCNFIELSYLTTGHDIGYNVIQYRIRLNDSGGSTTIKTSVSLIMIRKSAHI